MSAPPAPTENTDTVSSVLAVASSPPPGLNATENGALRRERRAGTGVSAPSAPTENTDTVLRRFAVASSPPSGLNATENGSAPVGNGEPGTWVSAPPAPTENTDTSSFSVCGREQPAVRAERHRERARAGRERRAGDLGERAARADREHRHVSPQKFAVASSSPSGLNATDTRARLPVANGEPVTWVSAPPAADREHRHLLS